MAQILPEYGAKLKTLVAEQPDLTLAQIKEKLAMAWFDSGRSLRIDRAGADI
jgi:hypothetical protein